MQILTCSRFSRDFAHLARSQATDFDVENLSIRKNSNAMIHECHLPGIPLLEILSNFILLADILSTGATEQQRTLPNKKDHIDL